MRKLSRWIPIIGGAVAGGIIALVIASSNHSTKTITTTVTTPQSASTEPAAFKNASTTGMTVNQIYKQDSPGVVDIFVKAKSTSSGNSLFGGGTEETEGEGAGVVYNSSGDILTDEHVVAGATSVKVTFSDGRQTTAKVIGTDASTDVGVIKVNVPSSELHPITFANSSDAQVGDPVVAIGSPFGLPETVTSGIVSQTGRTIEAPNNYSISDAIQTDAPINPGNSGGPLLNADGQVLGLNDQIETNNTNATTGEGSSSGVGFATPGDEDVKVANAIIAGNKPQHAYLGVSLVAPSFGPQSTAGAEIKTIATGGPAAMAGLETNDVITAVNGTAVTTTDSLIADLNNYNPGQTVTLTIKRQGQTKKIQVKLGNRPAGAPTAG